MYLLWERVVGDVRVKDYPSFEEQFDSQNSLRLGSVETFDTTEAMSFHNHVCQEVGNRYNVRDSESFIFESRLIPAPAHIVEKFNELDK